MSNHTREPSRDSLCKEWNLFHQLEAYVPKPDSKNGEYFVFVCDELEKGACKLHLRFSCPHTNKRSGLPVVSRQTIS